MSASSFAKESAKPFPEHALSPLTFQEMNFITVHPFRIRYGYYNTKPLRPLQAEGFEEKQEEIARMLSGEVISDEARAAARVLIGA